MNRSHSRKSGVAAPFSFASLLAALCGRSRRPAPASKPQPSAQLALEGLEERSLMAVDLTLSAGVLTITGDATNNSATVSASGSTIQASATYDLGGKTYTTAKTFTGVSQIRFFGNAGNDVFTNNTALASYAYGGAGDDVLYGGSGADLLSGDAGVDWLYGGAGDDTLYGGDGDDFFAFYGATLGKDVVADHSGRDTIDLRGLTSGAQVDLSKTTAQVVASGKLSLQFNFADAVDDVYGTNYNDTIVGNAFDNRIWGMGGDDTVYGGGGNDALQGGDGNDWIYGGDGADTLSGDAGNDVLQGQGGADTLYGGEGNDYVYGDGMYASSTADGADMIYGGAGDDVLSGGAGDDWLYGQAGKDAFYGDAGYDRYNDDFTLFVDGASMSDIQQGESGVCTILSAIATSFEERNWQNDVRYVGNNLYDVRLFNTNGTAYWERTTFDGTWTDDDARGKQSTTGATEAWVIIVQRAVLERHGVDWTKPSAQWAGGWQYLDVGLQAIHGGARSYNTLAGVSAAAFDQIVATKNVTVGSKPSGTTSGVVTSHAYAVLDVYLSNGQWFVNLFNPWGVDGQNGAITGANDGLLTLSWSAFTANFTAFGKA